MGRNVVKTAAGVPISGLRCGVDSYRVGSTAIGWGSLAILEIFTYRVGINPGTADREIMSKATPQDGFIYIKVY